MFLFVSIYWVYFFYLKDIWLVSFLNERQTKKEAPSRFATVLLFFRKRCHGLRRCFFFSGSAVTDCDGASFFPEALSRIATVLLFFRKRCHGLRQCFFFSGSAVTDCDSASFSPEALSRIVMSLPICFIYRDILG